MKQLQEIIKIFFLVCFISSFHFLSSSALAQNASTATFAAGCFWCAESDFEKVPGVIKVISGFTGGQLKNPSYEQVSAGGTGHYESIKVFYDPSKITYQQLLNVFWHNIDPEDAGGQFCDRGDQYRAVIFYENDQQKKLAEQSKAALLHSTTFKTIATQILPATAFYPAEEYHQQYAHKHPVVYKYYRFRCGRDERLKTLWTRST